MKKEDLIFDQWNEKKKGLNGSKLKNNVVKKRQIRLYYVWVNIWNEESKSCPFVRPCLIVNNYFKGDLVLVIPMTSNFNENLSEIYYQLNWDKYGLDKTSYLMINQIKVISKKRLIRKLNDRSVNGMVVPLLDNDSFLEIIEKIKNYI